MKFELCKSCNEAMYHWLNRIRNLCHPNCFVSDVPQESCMERVIFSTLKSTIKAFPSNKPKQCGGSDDCKEQELFAVFTEPDAYCNQHKVKENE